ncbi:hypothetical protein J437_LFUL011158, partial [Ladona fulva]
MDFFNNRMAEIYSPVKNLCIDESMVLWKGRLKFRIYVKGKKHKFGIKLYVLTESDGTVLKFFIYAGAKKCCFCTGTLMSNRKGNPSDVSRKKLKKGECFCQGETSSPINILKWKDKREVLLISTEYGSKLIEVASRRGSLVKKPEAVHHYNKNMGGVDKMDQMLSYFPNEHKNLIWYRKLGVHIFQMMMLNSHQLHNRYSGIQNDQYSFYNKIVDYLSGLAKTAKRRSQQESVISINSHFPRYTDFAEGGAKKRHRMQKRCRQCSKSEKRSMAAAVELIAPLYPILSIENRVHPHCHPLQLPNKGAPGEGGVASIGGVRLLRGIPTKKLLVASFPRRTLGYQGSTPLPDLSSLRVDIPPSSNFA